MPALIIFVGVLLVLILAVYVSFVNISAREVGILVKRWSSSSLPEGRLIALNGEAGYQADTLPPGMYFFKFWPWLYSVRKVPITVIPQGEIGLVVAADGAPIPSERILARMVECEKFQDARKFLMNGGEKGRQLGILTAGAYRINIALFTVITRANAQQQGMNPNDLLVHEIESDMVGIVTTQDGAPIDEGEIAGLYIPNHDNFQNSQAFLEAGGRRGLQEQVLLSGSWNLNPWFVQVEEVPMTQIPIGYVGVVISFVGKAHIDVSGTEFKHG
ncbi:MAG TPA: hypothetical protein VHO69_05765, partial [Phototrophicaceae bacterium]|nr:hypothetical protein [Phototrophicaceae bacterium]